MPGSAGQRRGYDQFCAIAGALDVVGERWTLLVVRDLLLGPKRYTDLRDGLPGIGTDLLTARLRTLEQAGLVRRRTLPRPAPAKVYELTERGYLLAPVLKGLAQVGFAQLGELSDDTAVPADRLAIALHPAFDPTAVPGLAARYELHLGDEPFTVAVRDGELGVTRGAAAGPVDLTLRTDQATLIRVLRGERDAGAALRDGSLRIDGARAELDRFVTAFSWERFAAA